MFISLMKMEFGKPGKNKRRGFDFGIEDDNDNGSPVKVEMPSALRPARLPLNVDQMQQRA
jgi:hypothetical protein